MSIRKIIILVEKLAKEMSKFFMKEEIETTSNSTEIFPPYIRKVGLFLVIT